MFDKIGKMELFTEIGKIGKMKSDNVEVFCYGRRLKATISYYENEKAFLVRLYTHGKKIIKHKLFFDDNKTRLENYQNASSYAMEYLQNCTY